MHQINLSLASFPLTRFAPALMLGMRVNVESGVRGFVGGGG